ncbi:MAG TPA: hypothetical protein VES67_15490 [Vicinamibacterales bacterium]|nr:hypothetical protein [Vicinamibacterales bacterium]
MAALGCAGLMFLGVHVALEGAARFAERHLDAYLWKEQDYLRLLSPANHADRGARRLLIYGPSEGREGLLPEEIARKVPGLEPYQNSQSLGTLEDGLVVLRYVEGTYGRSAVPAAILLGISTRFIGDFRTRPSPLWEGIDRYSPYYRVVRGTHPPELEPRTFLESFQPRVAMLSLQPDRYRRGLFAIASRTVTRFVPSLAENRMSWEPISASKHLTGKYDTEQNTKRWLTKTGNAWALVHAWDPELDRERVTREIRLYKDFASKHGTELYVVNLPELSWNRELYQPGRYEAYLRIVKAALGETPFLDLRTFLPDELFFDDCHPTWDGGVRVSSEVGAFIAAHRQGPRHVRSER